MANEIINLYEELEDVLNVSQTNVDAVLNAIDEKIKWYVKKINNPRYKAIVPIKTKALGNLKAQILENSDVINQHAATYAEIARQKLIEQAKTISEYESLFAQVLSKTISILEHKYKRDVAEVIEDVFSIRGIERFTDDTEKFNPHTQEVIETIPTEDLEMDYVIAKRVHKGYKWAGNWTAIILKRESVIIYKYNKVNKKEIKEVTDKHSPSKNSGRIFGIDLGTTYSCIAYVNEYGVAEVVNNQDGSPVTPSVVAFESDGIVSVGEAAKETLNSDPDNVCSTIKRQMGKRDYMFNAFGKEYSPETISALILKKITIDASEVLGEEVKDVVITCPAYFGLEERNATKEAGEIAGLNVLGILNEPTAAAISYGVQVETPQTVMVYDLGGGTFDVTILKVENGKIQIVATGGDHMLGGKDWDDAIREYAINTYCEQTGESSDSLYDDNEIMGELELKAETAKKQLTQKEKAILKLNGKKIEISRELFNEKNRVHLESTIKKTHETMDDAAKKGVTGYDKILLVGGSTRMPQVMERLKQEFPNTPIEFYDPAQSVAKGAAIYGNYWMLSIKDYKLK